MSRLTLEELSFDSETNILNFVIKEYNYKRKMIVSKLIGKFNRIINPINFVNEEILELNLSKDFRIKIISKIGIIPDWRRKEIKLDLISFEIDKLNKQLRSYEKEKIKYKFQKTNHSTTPTPFTIYFFKILLSFTIILIPFLWNGYISKQRAFANEQLNKKAKEYNKKHKLYIDEINEKLKLEIDRDNKLIYNKIFLKKQKYKKEEEREVKVVKADLKGWISLQKDCNFSYSELINKKGVYIIWNKTKNKYYVGQSKNIGRRMSQHFKNGDVKNILFAKDWYNNDSFAYKYYFCKTKDQLDSLEKQYIEKYNSFENGYNSTSGNI